MYKVVRVAIMFLAIFFTCSLNTQAMTVEEIVGGFKNVEVSPDGTAWRTLFDGPYEWLPSGDNAVIVDMNAESNLVPLEQGQHYYIESMDGKEVRVGYWKVQHSPAQCIHGGPSRRYPPLWAEEVRNKCVCRALARRDLL